jgi:acyl-[acyl carrier protein]--UDP-N-acetylglucosamine O-acyltransferase
MYENLLMNFTDYTMPVIETIIDFIGPEDLNCTFGNNTHFGPYSCIGKNSKIGNYAQYGPYVEVTKNCTIGINFLAHSFSSIHPITERNVDW